MGLAQKKPKLYKPEEYLELERGSEVRHEYIDGELYEMAGANMQVNRCFVA
ncbi:MAG: Uma2 family endonuclease [Acidobacteria bacterium]|jgi:Uma2 family endonuclease|nr:Uma2 family endonuclease [Acidobacteriota bacterium]